MCFSVLQEWAEELFNLASNLLVQNMCREACLEKAYVFRTHVCTVSINTRKAHSNIYLHHTQNEYVNQVWSKESGCHIKFVLYFIYTEEKAKYSDSTKNQCLPSMHAILQ